MLGVHFAHRRCYRHDLDDDRLLVQLEPDRQFVLRLRLLRLHILLIRGRRRAPQPYRPTSIPPPCRGRAKIIDLIPPRLLILEQPCKLRLLGHLLRLRFLLADQLGHFR
jgi:hypothetical protein